MRSFCLLSLKGDTIINRELIGTKASVITAMDRHPVTDFLQPGSSSLPPKWRHMIPSTDQAIDGIKALMIESALEKLSDSPLAVCASPIT